MFRRFSLHLRIRQFTIGKVTPARSRAVERAKFDFDMSGSVAEQRLRGSRRAGMMGDGRMAQPA
jgi:hypothetical protein